jgi:fluoride exporter
MIMTAVLVAIAGGIGAGSRFVLDGLIRKLTGAAFPFGTLIINLSGSLLLGLIAGLIISGAPTIVQVVAGTGFMGGYTTFSTASVETLRLLQERRWAAAISNGLGPLLLGTSLALLGLVVGQAV